MQDWLKVSLILCAFGTLREIRPSEPFVSEFLLGEWRNITDNQLTREVYPVGTYSYLSLLVVVFLITDFLRFKPVIILSGLSGIAVYAILLWTSSIEWLQASQFFYGLYMATEVAYLTYIYAKVDSAKYPVVSSFTRIAALTGRFLSGVSSQLLTHYGLMDYRQLNYITLTAQILATLWALWLPPVNYGIYFHRRNSAITIPIEKQPQTQQNTQRFHSSLEGACALIVRHARAAYSRPRVLAWSALYSVALALFVQAQTYVQLLWRDIQNETNNPVAYNGAVEAALPAPAAALQALALLLATHVPSVFVSYAGYVVMGTLYHYTITLASAKIADQLSDESCFGLIFGINTLLGTGLQSLLTYVLIQNLDVSIYTQYYALSGLFLLLALLWILGWMANKCRHKQSLSNQ